MSHAPTQTSAWRMLLEINNHEGFYRKETLSNLRPSRGPITFFRSSYPNLPNNLALTTAVDTAQDWIARVAKLLDGYRPQKQPQFRKAFSALVDEATDTGAFSPETVQMLSRAREFVEQWSSGNEIFEKDAWENWQEISNSPNRLPVEILEALLRRFPKHGATEAQWKTMALTLEAPLFRVLVRRRLLTARAIASIAKEDPQAFFHSTALDSLLNEGIAPPRIVWSNRKGDEKRRDGLMQPATALARAFQLDSAKDAADWFLRLACDGSFSLPDVLRGVLRSPRASYKLGTHAAEALAGFRKFPKAAVSANEFLSELLAACADTIGNVDDTGRGANTTVICLQAAAAATRDSLIRAQLQERSDLLSPATRTAMALAVQTADEKGSPSNAQLIAPVYSTTLIEVVRAHLRELPLGVHGAFETPELARRWERYQGRREVLEEVLGTLATAKTAEDYQHAIAAALHNIGVREFGEVGEELLFDVHRHETEIAGILPGDRVIVKRPGLRMGDEPNAPILRRALVTAAE